MVNCKGIHEAVLGCLFVLPVGNQEYIQISSDGRSSGADFELIPFATRIYDAQFSVINSGRGFGNVWKFAWRVLDCDTSLPMFTKKDFVLP